ncbi:MAG TPA: GAF domain-containing protein [Leifsonia sp.]
MDGDEPITFPDAPRAELDRTLSDLVDQARKVLDTQGRLRALVRANRAVVSHLELPVVLRTIVEAAVELVGARYGALGVIAEGGGLEQFIHVGMSADQVAEIGHLPEGHGLLGALIDDPRPIRIDSIASDPRSAGFPSAHPPMTAFLGVPIAVRDTVYGNLYLTEPASGGFTDDDEQLVRALAANAGFAIDNARLFAETAARQAWSAATAEMTATLQGTDTGEALEELTAHVARLTGAHLACVLEPDAKNRFVRLAVASGEVAAGLPTDFPLSDGQLRSVLEGSQASRVEDLAPSLPFDSPLLGPALLVPFESEDSRRSVLLAARRAGAMPFTAFDLERTAAFTRQAAIAIELAATRADRQRMLLLEDRARIARDLHDHVIQQLFGAGMELQSIESSVGPGPVSAQLDATVKILDDAIASIRTIIFALSRTGDDEDSLRHRLLDIVSEVGASLPEPATVSFSGPVDVVSERALADDIAAFVREGLTNVVRHAHAATASVVVKASADEITVAIADDGRGIGDTTRRSGLHNIAERARIRLGDLTVDSSTAGTQVSLRLPVVSGEAL